VSIYSYIANALVSVICIVVAWRATRPLFKGERGPTPGGWGVGSERAGASPRPSPVTMASSRKQDSAGAHDSTVRRTITTAVRVLLGSALVISTVGVVVLLLGGRVVGRVVRARHRVEDDRADAQVGEGHEGGEGGQQAVLGEGVGPGGRAAVVVGRQLVICGNHSRGQSGGHGGVRHLGRSSSPPC